WPRDWSSDVCSSDLIGRGSIKPQGTSNHEKNHVCLLDCRLGVHTWPRLRQQHGQEPLQGQRQAQTRRKRKITTCRLAATRSGARSEERRVGKECKRR